MFLFQFRDLYLVLDMALRSAVWGDANAFLSHCFHHQWDQRLSEEQHFLKCSQLSPSVKYNWHNLSDFHTSSVVRAIQYMNQIGGLISARSFLIERQLSRLSLHCCMQESDPENGHSSMARPLSLLWQPCNQQLLVVVSLLKNIPKIKQLNIKLYSYWKR